MKTTFDKKTNSIVNAETGEGQNMTNLTDEWLMASVNKIVDSVHDAYESASSNHHNIEEWEEEDWQLVNDAEFKAKESMLALVQQVRDAAKKEMDEKIAIAFADGEHIGIERVRVLAWGLIKNDKLDTAIRQMDGGK